MEEWHKDGPRFFTRTFEEKLCFCSRDILPGDWLVEGRIHIYFVHDPYCPFKILGVVSPAAEWITEGYETDDTDFEVHEKNHWQDETIIKFRNPKTKLFE